MDRRYAVLALGLCCFGLVLAVGGCSTTPGAPPASSLHAPLAPAGANCSGLAAKIASVGNVRITRSDLISDDPHYPAYCLVRGKVNERTGADGKLYAIGFEMRLPAAWNGRFLYQANGGNDGTVVPAVGAPNDLNAVGRVSALSRGFAVLSTDADHDGADPANVGVGLLAGSIFGLDPEARSDYGYASTAAMLPVAKALMKGYYGNAPSYSYMFGCSNGGRHGMVAASRYADYFDGILAGDPGFDLPKAAVQHPWDIQNFQTANPNVRKSFSREDMKLVAAKVVEKCDDLDGVKDGIVADMRACQRVFKLSDLECNGEKNDACLTTDQVKALERSMGGPETVRHPALFRLALRQRNGRGKLAFLEDRERSASVGRLSSHCGHGRSLSRSHLHDAARHTSGIRLLSVGFLARYDFDKDAPKIYAREGIFKESAMEFMTPRISRPQARRFQGEGRQDDRLSRSERRRFLRQRHRGLVREAREQLRRRRQGLCPALPRSRHEPLLGRPRNG